MHNQVLVPRLATWAYTHNESRGRIIAAQHFCGIDGHAINARLDEADNGYCPRCHEMYAAAEQAYPVPLRTADTERDTEDIRPPFPGEPGYEKRKAAQHAE